MKYRTCCVPAFTLAALVASFCSQATAAEIEDPRIQGTTVTRDGNTLMLSVDEGVKEVQIPRFFASLQSIKFNGEGTNTAQTLKVTPEPEYWRIAWKNAAKAGTVISVTFDTKPLLASETQPVVASGDGRFRLEARQAVTSGEKIRFEPQPHKNTVGYWVGKKDQATWTIRVEQPGVFNVGILQGCGKGQGGSQAAIVVGDSAAQECAKLEFTVQETGHFQNFQWRHLGTLEIEQPGVHTLSVRPTKIARAALMDVRELQLVKLPAKK